MKWKKNSADLNQQHNFHGGYGVIPVPAIAAVPGRRKNTGELSASLSFEHDLISSVNRTILTGITGMPSRFSTRRIPPSVFVCGHLV